MLVLSRKVSEKVHIGDDVIITVVRISGNSVRIGIEAPSDVRVRRHELVIADTQADAERAIDATSAAPSAVDPAAAG